MQTFDLRTPRLLGFLTFKVPSSESPASAMSSAVVARKVVVNAQGTPVEVILSWKSFQQIAEALGWDLNAEALGWDLNAEAKADLRATRRDLAKRDSKAFVPLSSL